MDDIFRAIEKEKKCAQFVVVRNKKNSLRDLCEFSTRVNPLSPRKSVKNLSFFPSFSQQFSSFDTTGTVIILDSKKERNLMKKGGTEKILQVYTPGDHVKCAKPKYFKKCSFMLTTMSLCRKFANDGAPRAMTSFKNFNWKIIIVIAKSSRQDKITLKRLFPRVFIWYMVTEPDETVPRVYDTPLPKHDVSEQHVQVESNLPLKQNVFWKDVDKEHSPFFLGSQKT
jgi:hypothetical protein